MGEVRRWLNLEPGPRGTIPWLRLDAMTVPSKVRVGLVCLDRCEVEPCALKQEGCASECVRYPDHVCGSCPCRASKWAELVEATIEE